MEDNTRALAAWAARMIREQDEICRSQIPNYGTFSQEEMHLLKELEELAAGAEPATSQDWRGEIKDILNDIAVGIDRITDLDIRGGLDKIDNAGERLDHLWRT